MQKIVFIKEYGNNKKGDERLVDNNIAHMYIDRKVAVLKASFVGQKEMENAPANKMVSKRKKKITINTK